MVARRMHESLANSAQLTFNATLDAEPLCRLVGTARAAGETTTVADYIARFFVDMLLEMPTFNATVEDDVLTLYNSVNLGIAVATPAHLVVPVIRSAERLDVAGLAAARRHFSELALQGTLPAADMKNASATVSNLGAGRTESFTPILNPPQVCLLGVAGLQKTPRVASSGELAVGRTLGLSLTVDHRVIDGAPANQFLTRLCERLETP